jgi:TRAP transporter 4TM/12TM fusion protein
VDTESDNGRYRRLQGPVAKLAAVMLAAPVILGSLWAAEVQTMLGLLVFREQFLAVMLGLGLVSSFILVRASKRASATSVPWYDWIFCGLSAAVCGYVAVNYQQIVFSSSSLSAERVILGALALLLVFEATRRLIGYTLVLIALAFVLYARFGDLMPGVFAVPSSSWERIIVYTYLDSNGLLGMPIAVAAITIVTFVLFGAMLKAVRGDTFITDLALVAMGRYRGGPAKVSVVASTLFGTVSGSAVSNVAVVGPISIPMMQKSGYPAPRAAAIEAVSSTGGQMMPPVMGITAFLMADFLAIPYSEVVLAALIPALLYYIAIFVQVDLEAAREGLKGLARGELPRLRTVLTEGYAFAIPLALLLYTVMFAHWPPGRAGLAAAACALIVGMLRRRTRPSLSALWGVLIATGRVTMDILILTAVAGIIIGALQVSGVSFSMSSILLALAGDNVLLILLMTGVVCVILGMALPTAVIYTMLAVLVAPALTQLGVEPLAAHLFIFYMGMLSMITPPVCFATFTAASIVGANVWQTAFAGMRYGIIAYILPFIFPFSLGLIMQGPAVNVLLATGTAILGTFALGWALVGYMFRPLNIAVRVVLFACGIAIMPSPMTSEFMLVLNTVAFLVGGAVFAFEFFATRGSRVGTASRNPPVEAKL